MNTCNNKWEICNYDAFLVNPSVCHLIFDGICNVYLHLSARLNEKPTVTNGFTDAAGCRGDQRCLLWLWRRAALLPSVAAHFPWGDFTYNIPHLNPQPHPPHPHPIPVDILDRLLSAEAVRPHTCWEVQRSPSKQGHTITIWQQQCKKTNVSYFRKDGPHSERERVWYFWMGGFSFLLRCCRCGTCSVWLLGHMTDRRRGRLLRLADLSAVSSGPKGITRPSSICLHIPQ